VWALATALGPLAAVLLVGCGGGKGDVSGLVTYKGEPLPFGRITFVSQVGNKPSLTARIRTGKYTIAACPAGPVQIAVESLARPLKGRPSMGGITKGFVPPEDEDAVEPSAKQPRPVTLPPRYNIPEESGLDYTVTSGQQTHDIPLNP
jgi:hypothetical protein